MEQDNAEYMEPLRNTDWESSYEFSVSFILPSVCGAAHEENMQYCVCIIT